ncbi:MAG TPA: DNA alkylation repair protein [Niabella sp.]|nr:DNA alkylation repair protein [Niabella sp.]HQX21573.1 DNA alkylation repair protein [Niabella sp.]HRB37193.1 DNA alkylation repair protein [Niabella sp.]HRB42003.1 DNA alkylation repair protein [Niabella sp.]HRB47974.1 DNA alkylation repair protein [Niabella sp.]
MKHSAKNILTQIADKNTKFGDLRNIAKEIKKDHQLAIELWAAKNFFARQLAILIMDKKLLTEKAIDNLISDINQHKENERLQLIDWLMANQLTKDKTTLALIESWQDSKSSLKRRIFWYYQGRLRWMGQIPPTSNDELLFKIENKIEKEEPEVQWAMNFLVGWIGVYDKKYRKRCIILGEKTGLYKGKMVSKGCTPEYLPEFIAIESNKRNL